jgi:DNA-binding phage protein
MTRLAEDLGVSRQRVHQILRHPGRKPAVHKLTPVMGDITMDELAEAIGLSRHGLGTLLRPGSAGSALVDRRWAGKIARVLEQPHDVIAHLLESNGTSE